MVVYRYKISSYGMFFLVMGFQLLMLMMVMVIVFMIEVQKKLMIVVLFCVISCVISLQIVNIIVLRNGSSVCEENILLFGFSMIRML